MCVETGLSSVLASKSACVGKNAKFCHFKKNVWVKLYSCFTKDCSIRIICVQYTKSVYFIRVVAIAFCKNCLDYTCQMEVRAGQ